MATMLLPLVMTIGGMLLSRLFAPKQKDSYGSRLSDINVPQVSPGNPIPRVWGTMKMLGQLMWTSRLKETEHVTSQSSGKGGSSSPKTHTYTYAVDAAVGVCRGPVYRVRRIWANQKLLWINPDIAGEEQNDFDAAYYSELDRLVNQEYLTDLSEAYASAFFFAYNNYSTSEYTHGSEAQVVSYCMAHPGTSLSPPVAAPNQADLTKIVDQMLSGLARDTEYQSNKVRYDELYIYLGTDEQLPSSLMESYMEVGNVPSYRNMCYFVMQNLQLEDFGNAIPNFNIEVQMTNGDVALFQVLHDICSEAGLESSEYNSLGYMDQTVTLQGFAITQNATARDAIQDLQKVFPFDAAESGFKLVFNWINQRPFAVVRRQDFGAHVDSEEIPASEQVTRMHDYDLPKRYNLKYQEPVRNYSTNTVFAMRTQTDATSVEDQEAAVALTRSDAKKWVEEMLAFRFASRRTYKVALPRKYVVIEPGDCVLFPDKDYADFYYSARCIQTDIGANGVIEATFTDHFFHVDMIANAGQDLVVSNDTNNAQTDTPTGSPTYAYLLDCPLITDTETDNVGFYAGLIGTKSGWTGGVLMLDLGAGGSAAAFGSNTVVTSSGSNWYTAATASYLVPHGYAMNALGSAHPEIWDDVNSIQIYLLDRDLALSSATKSDILTQGLNTCVVGDEILAFADAKDLSNGNWKLSGLLRGLRGTEAAIGSHTRGERFLRLNKSAVQRVKHDQQYLGQTGTYRAVSIGDTTENSESFTFTNTGNSLRPRAPMFRRCLRDTARGVTLSWAPRARQNGGWYSGRTTALDQTSESYEIDIVQGGAVKATKSLTGRSFDYTAAQQTSDGVNSASSITVNLYQIGSIIGRGYVSELTL